MFCIVAGLVGLVWEWSPLPTDWGLGWGVAGLAGWFLSGGALSALTYALFLDVAYTRFDSIAKQTAVVETLLPLGAIEGLDAKASDKTEADAKSGKAEVDYEFLPSAASILEEVVPTSFKVKLFKCFLDAAVSEQVARMTAMKAATDNANKIIKKLSMTYNRARQSQITGEIMEVLGGVEALKNK